MDKNDDVNRYEARVHQMIWQSLKSPRTGKISSTGDDTKITMGQKSRILEELDKRHLNTEVWKDLDKLDKMTAMDVISAFTRHDDDLAINQMKHLGVKIEGPTFCKKCQSVVENKDDVICNYCK